jgi:hypothetical protein
MSAGDAEGKEGAQQLEGLQGGGGLFIFPLLNRAPEILV